MIWKEELNEIERDSEIQETREESHAEDEIIRPYYGRKLSTDENRTRNVESGEATKERTAVCRYVSKYKEV